MVSDFLLSDGFGYESPVAGVNCTTRIGDWRRGRRAQATWRTFSVARRHAPATRLHGTCSCESVCAIASICANFYVLLGQLIVVWRQERSDRAATLVPTRICSCASSSCFGVLTRLEFGWQFERESEEDIELMRWWWQGVLNIVFVLVRANNYTIHLLRCGPGYFWKPTLIKSYIQSSYNTYVLTN